MYFTFRYISAVSRKSKGTFNDHLQRNDEIVCSRSNVEGDEEMGKCLICNKIYQTCEAMSYRHDPRYSTKDLIIRKKGDKKKQRFSFFEKNFQDKKEPKDHGNRNTKKILEKSIARKRKKVSNIFHGDCRQCVRCKCNLNHRENIFRAKEKELLKQSRAMKMKQRKGRKMKLQNVETDVNACLKDTCN